MTPHTVEAPPNGRAIALISAMAKNRVIGAHNDLPWKLPGDMKRFRQLTLGHTIIMGRKTYDSMGQPLPGRNNIVVTRNQNFAPPGVTVARSIDDAINAAPAHGLVYVIGGGEIYAAAIGRAQFLRLTIIDHEYEGDAHFPAFDAKDWQVIAEEQFAPTEQFAYGYAFIDYARR